MYNKTLNVWFLEKELLGLFLWSLDVSRDEVECIISITERINLKHKGSITQGADTQWLYLVPFT